MFGRKRKPQAAAAAPATTLVSGPYDGTPLRNQVPARLRVGAVTPPGQPRTGDAALVSGLLLGPFQVMLVQATAALPRADWPEPGTELPAAADPVNPMRFAVVWSTGPDHTGGAPADPARSDQHGWGQHELLGWDEGPGGEHTRAITGWLAANGFMPGDFGPALAQLSPGLARQLAAACAQYATVIAGRDSVALMRTGQPAQGTVAAVRQLPIPAEMLPSPQACMAFLTLDVTPSTGTGPAGNGYRTTIRFGFRSPERFAALATVGTQLPLRADPAEPRRVTIDLPALGIVPG
jgi:hypothetical protein